MNYVTSMIIIDYSEGIRFFSFFFMNRVIVKNLRDFELYFVFRK